MLAWMTETEAKWSERVKEWRASRRTAEEFAEGRGFEGSTLRYWASRLKTGGTVNVAPSLARVVRRRHVVRPELARNEGLDVVVGTARIVVRRGFDAELLRAIAVALGGVR
jgi:hypothetical protein